MRRSVDFWYLGISWKAMVPGRYLWGFFTPAVAGVDLRAALLKSLLRGTFLLFDLWAVCLVGAMVITSDVCVGGGCILVY